MSPKANLLFIFTDEQRFDTLACYESANNAYPGGVLEMPNLNRFAETATVFEEAYCTQPVCTPSRGSIMTGLYPLSHGAYSNNIRLNTEARTLPELIDCRNCRTAYHGKWHLGDEIFAQHGFSEWRSIEDEYRSWYGPEREQNRVCDYTTWLCENGFKPDKGDIFSRGRVACLPRDFTKPAFLAREACRFLEEHQSERFIHYVNFLEPHMPFFGPLTERYDPAEVPLPPNFKDRPGPDLVKAHAAADKLEKQGFEWYDLRSERGWRQMIAAYMGLNTLVDHYVGQILTKLNSLGLAENTIVVFTSDHGEMMGSHRLIGKQHMYQESIRVPLLIRVPGQRHQARISGASSQIDLVPTLIDLLDEPVPAGLHGTSRAGLLRGQADARLEEDVLIHWNPGPNTQVHDSSPLAVAKAESTRTIITPEGWRFTHCPDSGAHELFHLREDPLETRNLAHDPAFSETMKDLRARLATLEPG